MKGFRSIYSFLLTALLTLFIIGCGSSSDDGGGSSSTGVLNLSVTDAPVDKASSVVVAFTGVIIQPSSGDRLEFDFDPNDPSRKIDLLALNSGGSVTILDGVTVPAGHYNWIRLKVNAECNTLDSYIEIRLKLFRGFIVPDGGTSSFTIDFDLRKSVNHPEGQGYCSGDYKLKPTLRIVDNARVGSISGAVSSELIEDGACTDGNAVYVFEGHNITPDDEDGFDPNPVTSAIVEFDDVQGYTYKIAFLNAGNYTVAFTCQADNDTAKADESIAFTGPANVTVSSGMETIHNFQ
jgi:hypothetical protein